MRLPHRLLAGVVAVVALAAAGCAGTAATTPADTDPCTTIPCAAVPDLVGMPARQAWETLARTAFTPPVELAGRGADVVVDHQTPAAGTQAPSTTPILLLFRTSAGAA